MDHATTLGVQLHHLQLLSPDPERLAAFHADAMDMDARPMGGAGWICEGPGRRLLVAPAGRPGFGFAGFACPDRAALDALAARLCGKGLDPLPSPSPLFRDGAVAVRDPDGNLFAFGLAEPDAPRPGLYAPLQHLALASPDPDALLGFYRDRMGFRLSDEVRDTGGRLMACWLRTTREHHALAVFRHATPRLDHLSFEAGDWILIRDWCDRMGERRLPLIWGPGRHGPGNNLFAFIADPDGNWIEISAELETVDDRPPRCWPHEEHTMNLWGRGILRA